MITQYGNFFQRTVQTCQLSRFCRETPGYFSFLPASRQRPEISRFFQDSDKKCNEGWILFRPYALPLDCVVHARSLHCPQSLGVKFVNFMHCFRYMCPSVEQMASAKRGHDYLVLLKIGYPLTFLVISVSDVQTTANSSTALLIRRCLKYFKFVSKVFFESWACSKWGNL